VAGVRAPGDRVCYGCCIPRPRGRPPDGLCYPCAGAGFTRGCSLIGRGQPCCPLRGVGTGGARPGFGPPEELRYWIRSHTSPASPRSVAASYYAMKKPSKETAVLGPSGALTEDYKTFFAGYKDT